MGKTYWWLMTVVTLIAGLYSTFFGSLLDTRYCATIFVISSGVYSVLCALESKK